MTKISVFALTMLLGGAAGAQAPRAATTAHEKLAREVYQELVEINTSDSVGSTTKAARAMAARFIAAGFPAQDVQVLIPAADTTHGNLVVRFRAAPGSKLKPLLLLAHLDVVAALRSDWSRDPFKLEEENGFFYGRGVADDKAMAAIFVANLLQYKAQGYKPNRDIILALTAAEEGGENNGVEFLIADHRDVIDAAFAINEGGGGTLGADLKPQFNSIQAAEKVPLNFTLTVRNSGGHSSVPRPDNAIYSLSNALVRLASFRFPVSLNPVTRAFFEQTAKVERPEFAAAMRAISANSMDSAAAAILSRDNRYASMLRTTCVATRLFGGHANNALPQTATANVNCRIVPTSSTAETQATLARVFNDTSVAITFTPGTSGPREKYPTSTPSIDPELLSVTTALTRTMYGDIPVVPSMSTGATDGRFLRAVGIPTYGVSGIMSVGGETNAHGRDEKLRTKSFYDGLAFLDQLVRRLSGGK